MNLSEVISFILLPGLSCLMLFGIGVGLGMKIEEREWKPKMKKLKNRLNKYQSHIEKKSKK